MKVFLSALKPNPLRDFSVDPIDQERVARLKESITGDGFWGGVVCCRNCDGIVIVAGHHRIEAAITAGITDADLFVAAAMDDVTLARIMARENATQRGNEGTAFVGSIAAALRVVAKSVLRGDICEISQMSPRAVETINGNLCNEKGIGRDLILDVLKGVPGVRGPTVQDALANLKKSGDYARIIAEVSAEIEQEAEERRLEAEKAEANRQEAVRRAEEAKAEDERQRAEADAEKATVCAAAAEEKAAKAKSAAEKGAKAKAAAARQEVTFDLHGVQKYLRVPDHVNVFREMVTGQGMRPYLAVEDQAAVAERLVAMVKKGELTAHFIRQNLQTALLQVKEKTRQISEQEKEQMLRGNWHQKCTDLQDHFTGAVRQMMSYGLKLSEHIDNIPAGEMMRVRQSMRDSLSTAARIVKTLEEKL